jgi:hypothetical protein
MVVVAMNITEGISRNRAAIINTTANNFFFCLNNLKANAIRIIPPKNNKSMKTTIKAEIIFSPTSFAEMYAQ